MSKIIEASQLARRLHAGQARKDNGSPHINHVIRVAGRVMTLDDVSEEMVIASWLHDTVEDTSLTLSQIDNSFGGIVCKMVNDLTNVSIDCPELPRETRKMLDRQHLSIAWMESKRIKLVDRIDNLNEGLKTKRFDWIAMYIHESRLLLSVLQGVDSNLEDELEQIIRDAESLSKGLASAS